MLRERSRLAVLLSHSGLFTLALLGAVIFAVLRFGADPDLDALAVPSSSECALVGDNGASVHVARDGAEGHASMKLEIRDAQAQVVGILHVFADGELALEPAGSDPVRFIFYRMPGGVLGLGEPDGGADIARGVGHDGSVYVDVLFRDRRHATVPGRPRQGRRGDPQEHEPGPLRYRGPTLIGADTYGKPSDCPLRQRSGFCPVPVITTSLASSGPRRRRSPARSNCPCRTAVDSSLTFHAPFDPADEGSPSVYSSRRAECTKIRSGAIPRSGCRRGKEWEARRRPAEALPRA